MPHRGRAFALILCLFMALVLVVSSVFIIYEADHVCTAEDCEICARITAAAFMLRGFSLAGIIVPALLAALIAARKCRAPSKCLVRPAPSPVAWKIRLNN
ncbi:MAG: hypothetical protein IKI84_10695 [Clostridia bacterium]|nr:hypothetical protein [Clostridia bacterium]